MPGFVLALLDARFIHYAMANLPIVVAVLRSCRGTAAIALIPPAVDEQGQRGLRRALPRLHAVPLWPAQGRRILALLDLLGEVPRKLRGPLRETLAPLIPPDDALPLLCINQQMLGRKAPW
jgi:hypothetical protein